MSFSHAHDAPTATVDSADAEARRAANGRLDGVRAGHGPQRTRTRSRLAGSHGEAGNVRKEPNDGRKTDTLTSGRLAEISTFLRERLDHGNTCLMAGNARGAITYYESALTAFFDLRDERGLQVLFHALWNNKAIAHQQLKAISAARHATMVANSLLPPR